MYDYTQAILHASLNRSSLSVEKFSRWLRAICTILLSRNGQDDRTRAIGYVEQAINVLEEHSDDRQDDAAVGCTPPGISLTKCVLSELPRGRATMAPGHSVQHRCGMLPVFCFDICYERIHAERLGYLLVHLFQRKRKGGLRRPR